MQRKNRWLAAGLLATGLMFPVVPALVWAEAEEPAKPSTTSESNEAKAAPPASSEKPSKSAKRISGFTEEREAAAMTFVRMNHPELATLLDQLKLNDNTEYQRAIRELFHSSEKLAQLQERSPKRYPVELEAWKLNSRIQLLVARLSMSPDPKVEDQLRQSLLQQHELRKAALEEDRQRLESRLTDLKEQLNKLGQQQNAYVEQRMAKLLSEANRSRSELKAGSKKKKAEKRSDSETSSTSRSKDNTDTEKKND